MNDSPSAPAGCLSRHPDFVVLILSFIITALLVLPAGSAEVTRTVVQDPSTGDAAVTLLTGGLIDGGVAEVLPDGWQIRQQGTAGMMKNDGNVVAFRVRNTSSVSYVVTTGGHPEKIISGFWEDYATMTNGTVSGAGWAPAAAPMQTAKSPGFAGIAAVTALFIVLCIVLTARHRGDRR